MMPIQNRHIIRGHASGSRSGDAVESLGVSGFGDGAAPRRDAYVVTFVTFPGPIHNSTALHVS